MSTPFGLELLSDYDCDIRYHPGKANVVADALSRKERIEPLRVRALVMTIGFGSSAKRILESQNQKAQKPRQHQLIQETTEKIIPNQTKGCKRHKIDKDLTPIEESESRWSSKLETELCSRSHPGKESYGSVSGAKLNPEGIHVDDKLQFVEEPVEINGTEIKRLKRSGYLRLRFAGTLGGALSSPGNVKIRSNKNTHNSSQTGLRHLLQGLKL
ncbi:hypothetical protein Tco_1404263 [Tanacetum coccineum]